MATINSNNNKTDVSDFTIGTGDLALSTTNAALTTGVITVNAVPFMHAFGTENTFLGELSGNGTLTSGSSKYNTGVGYSTLNALTTGSYNTAVGRKALILLTQGSNNTAMGASALYNLTTTGNNTAAGYNAGANIVTGTNNTLLGYSAGSSLTLANSSNIIIGNTGTVGDSNKIRIGTTGSGAGQQNKCYVAGISGVAVTSGLNVVINSSGELGTAGFPLYEASVTLTSAQVKALNATPISIIASPGDVYSVIVPITTASKLVYAGTNPFTGAGNIQCRYVGAAQMIIQPVTNSTVVLSADTIEITNWINDSYADTSAAMTNLAIELFADAAITGNAANNNTIIVKIIYTIVSLH